MREGLIGKKDVDFNLTGHKGCLASLDRSAVRLNHGLRRAAELHIRTNKMAALLKRGSSGSFPTKDRPLCISVLLSARDGDIFKVHFLIYV